MHNWLSVFRVAEALILGTLMVGQASAFAPNYNKAVVAASRIFELLDRKPAIDSNFPSKGNTPVSSSASYDVIDHNPVVFKVTSEGRWILSKPDLRIRRENRQSPSGPEFVSVQRSESGLGGSQRLRKIDCYPTNQRFYDITSGALRIDGQRAEELSVPWVRSVIGIVSQEPDLFDRSLADNIRYGDNSREVSMDEVVRVAKAANIHSFIASLPQVKKSQYGFECCVLHRFGFTGLRHSSGEPRWAAVRRAEATRGRCQSADQKSDSAAPGRSDLRPRHWIGKGRAGSVVPRPGGRTSITIAHRLSTIQNSDKIFVINHGKVSESGTHQELLSKRGFIINCGTISRIKVQSWLMRFSCLILLYDMQL